MPALILAVVTFHSIGLTWDPDGGSAANACEAQYRAMGETAWREAEPLWFDARRESEYRGSLVHLRPGTTYEIRPTLADGTTQTTTATTWSETFPIARTIDVGSRDTAFVATESGTEDGYVLYEN